MLVREESLASSFRISRSPALFHTMMNPWTSIIRKQATQIRAVPGRNPSSIFPKSAGSSIIGGGRRRRYDDRSYGWTQKHNSSSLLGVFLVIVGSSLGLYQSSDSSLSYADLGVGSIETKGQDKRSRFIFKDTYRRKVFFKYEKRMRTQSPPEKVFDYFASFRTPSGEVYMTPADLMRAVVPVFPPSDTDVVRGGFLNGETAENTLIHSPPSEFFMLFDTDNDGLVSFPEYIFLVTILSIPESSFSVAFKMFDLNNDGGIDKEEFKKVMSLMRNHNRQGASHSDGKRSGMKVSGSVDDGGLLEYFFGKDGNKRLEHDKFVQFLRDLHDEILRLEFSHYDHKSQGTISAKDFALSMVAAADMRYIDKFLDRVDELNDEPSLRDVRVGFDEFVGFAQLRRRLEPFSVAIFSYGKINGLLSKQDFIRAAYQVCGVSLTDKIVDLVFYMFDTNGDGSLSSDEFLRVLERRENDISQPRSGGLAGLLTCWKDCAKSSSSKRPF